MIYKGLCLALLAMPVMATKKRKHDQVVADHSLNHDVSGQKLCYYYKNKLLSLSDININDYLTDIKGKDKKYTYLHAAIQLPIMKEVVVVLERFCDIINYDKKDAAGKTVCDYAYDWYRTCVKNDKLHCTSSLFTSYQDGSKRTKTALIVYMVLLHRTRSCVVLHPGDAAQMERFYELNPLAGGKNAFHNDSKLAFHAFMEDGYKKERAADALLLLTRGNDSSVKGQNKRGRPKKIKWCA